MLLHGYRSTLLVMRLDTSKLKRLRIAAGETQKQTAARVGISDRSYRLYEAGTVTLPQAKTIRALADAFAVSTDDLIVEDGQPAAATR